MDIHVLEVHVFKSLPEISKNVKSIYREHHMLVVNY